MATAFLDHPVPFGFAHQGGHDVAPGNTAAAFAHAVSLGYRYIETDVQATADGVLIVFHDDDLGPLTGREGKVADLPWSEVAELTIGDEHEIPRFEDVVERYPSTRFNVEPKNDGAVDLLIDLIRRHHLEDRICVGSFSDRRLRRFRRRLGSPSVCTSPAPVGVVAALLSAVAGRRIVPSPHRALQIPVSAGPIPLTSRWLVGRFQRLGWQVHVWTINDEAEMHRLLDHGVDAVMTDEVELLREVLRSRDQWTPAPEG